jgi:enoyl-[acyl-carrier protein] reductase II
MPADTFANIKSVYFDGDMEAAPALAGQSAGLIHEVKPVKDIIDEMVAQFAQITARLGTMAAGRNFG